MLVVRRQIMPKARKKLQSARKTYTPESMKDPKPGRQLVFRTTDRDEAVLAAIGRSEFGQLKTSALLRVALERFAISVGVWTPEPDPSEPSKAEVAISLQARD